MCWFFCTDLWWQLNTDQGRSTQHWERNSIHSPWTMCCSRKDHRRTENWSAVAHIPKERWQSCNAFVKRNWTAKFHCEPVWHASWKHQAGKRKYKQQNSSSISYSNDEIERKLIQLGCEPQSKLMKETGTREEVWRDGTHAVSSRAEEQARKRHLFQMLYQRTPSIVLQDLQTS